MDDGGLHLEGFLLFVFGLVLLLPLGFDRLPLAVFGLVCSPESWIALPTILHAAPVESFLSISGFPGDLRFHGWSTLRRNRRPVPSFRSVPRRIDFLYSSRFPSLLLLIFASILTRDPSISPGLQSQESVINGPFSWIPFILLHHEVELIHCVLHYLIVRVAPFSCFVLVLDLRQVRMEDLIGALIVRL